jgi:hypothetical protein
MNKAMAENFFKSIGVCNMLCEKMKCGGAMNRFLIKIGGQKREIFFFTYRVSDRPGNFKGNITWGSNGLSFNVTLTKIDNQLVPVVSSTPHSGKEGSAEERMLAVSECFIELAKRLKAKDGRRENKSKGGGSRDYQAPQINALSKGKTLKTSKANIDKCEKLGIFDPKFAASMLLAEAEGIACRGGQSLKG